MRFSTLFLGNSYTAESFQRYRSESFFEEQEEYLVITRAIPVTEETTHHANASSQERVLEFTRLSRHPLLIVDPVSEHIQTEGTPHHPYRDLLYKIKRIKEFILIHISSTSVYGLEESRPIAEVNESSLPSPASPQAERRMQMEETLIHDHCANVVIRSGAIYGPKRSIIRTILSNNMKRWTNGNRMISRIHIFDLLQLIFASAESCRTKSNPSSPWIINGVDQEPCSIAEMISFAEELLGEHRLAEYYASQELCGRKTHSVYAKELIDYRFPSYRTGMTEIYKSGEW